MKTEIQELRQLILDDEELKTFRIDESYIRRFLHFADMDVSLALKKMKDFHKLFVQYPNWFAFMAPLDIKSKIEQNDKALLKGRDKFGRVVFVIKLGKIDAKNSSPQEQCQLLEIWLEFIMEDLEGDTKGMSVIIDMNGYSWSLFRWVTPTNVLVSTKKIDLYPCKEFVFHVVNTSFLVNATIKIVWPFLSERIKKMVKFHFENWPSLQEYVAPEVLPIEYGGSGPDIDFDKSNTRLFDKSYEIGERLKCQNNY